MRFAVGIFLLPLLALWAAPPVPYYGKVSIDGINYHGSAQFQFSLEDANGTEHWRNGVDANESIRVFVVNGRYSVMLGGQGMTPLPPEFFLQHEELYLSVSFDKGGRSPLARSRAIDYRYPPCLGCGGGEDCGSGKSCGKIFGCHYFRHAQS